MKTVLFVTELVVRARLKSAHEFDTRGQRTRRSSHARVAVLEVYRLGIMPLTRGAFTTPLALPSGRRHKSRLVGLRVVIPGIRSTRASRGFLGTSRVDRCGIAVESAGSGDTKPRTTDKDPIIAARRFRLDDPLWRQRRRTSTEGSFVTTREATTPQADARQITTSPFAKAAAALAIALVSVFTSAIVPPVVHAARVDAVPATKAAQTLNPNLIRIPSSTREKLDAFFLKRVQDCRGVMVALDEHVNDPWEIEDAWLIVAWHFAISKGRRAAFDASRKRLGSGKDTTEADAELAEAWEGSFHKWVKRPMQAVGALWVTLYLFDNAVRVGTLLEMSRWLPETTIAQFDRGMYTLTAGVISVMATDRWLPDFLRDKVNIKDASQRLVLTRLTTVALAMGSVASSAVVFGLPARSLLGFGGIGGLTFGLAAKDLVSNFIGGSMLAIVRPFSPGEKVYLMAVGGRFRGTNEPSVGGYLVKDIGWYQTTLIPKDTRPTTVPNGFFLGANVINISRQTARVIIINLRVRYEDLDTVPAMTAAMEAYLCAHDAVIQPPEKPIRVHLRAVKDDHAAIRVEAHSHVVKKDAFLAVNQEIALAIFAIHKKHATGPAWPVRGLMQLAPPDYATE